MSVLNNGNAIVAVTFIKKTNGRYVFRDFFLIFIKL